MVRPVEAMKRKSALASMTKTKQQYVVADMNGVHSKDESFSDVDSTHASDADSSEEMERPNKKAKEFNIQRNGKTIPYDTIVAAGETSKAACQPPLRKHALPYHRSLLLDIEEGRTHRENLLKWYDGVSLTRSMPWRKSWISPSNFDDEAKLREAWKRRAYEVWISEIMLQQTRVSTVITYWKNWIAKWPTIEDLARAEPEEVLSAWRGLGYYSRATRIHTAAKKVVEDVKMQGLLPETAEELQKNVPGVGRYTGGAIASIVFGNAAPMVDGNVLRVLSRQLGIYGDVKSSKQIIDLLWDVANSLVKQIAVDASSDGVSINGKSERPGLWGQALMELGSTICTPHPSCRTCPVSSSCKVYAEGKALAIKEGVLETKAQEVLQLGDIEDICSICQDFSELDLADKNDVKKASKGEKMTSKKSPGRQAILSAFAFTGTNGKSASTTKAKSGDLSLKAMDIIESHAKKFPMKISKKAVREEEAVVCAIRNSKREYLLHQRPAKGLLAGMWEFPTWTLPDSNDSIASDRTLAAQDYVSSIVDKTEKIDYLGEVDSIPWVFSHLKLTMHVHLFQLPADKTSDANQPRNGRWANASQVEAESMGTGMRKCWTVVKDRS